MGPTLVVKSAVDSDAGEYYCMVTNKGGPADSDIAFIKLLDPHFSRAEQVQRGLPPGGLRGHYQQQQQQQHSIVGGMATGIPRNFSLDDLTGRGYLEEPSQRRSSLRFSSLRRNSGGEFWVWIAAVWKTVKLTVEYHSIFNADHIRNCVWPVVLS